jgi:cobalamin biosynthesis protein CobD/CbiB
MLCSGLNPDLLPMEIQRWYRRNDWHKAFSEAFGTLLWSLAILSVALLILYISYALYENFGWGWVVAFVAVLFFGGFGLHVYFVGEGDRVFPGGN